VRPFYIDVMNVVMFFVLTALTLVPSTGFKKVEHVEDKKS